MIPYSKVFPGEEKVAICIYRRYIKVSFFNCLYWICILRVVRTSQDQASFDIKLTSQIYAEYNRSLCDFFLRFFSRFLRITEARCYFIASHQPKQKVPNNRDVNILPFPLLLSAPAVTKWLYLHLF